MKKEKYQRYICWGVTAFIVLALLVALIFLIMKWGRVRIAVRMIVGILAPVIYGAVFAYLLSPIYNRVMCAVVKKTGKYIPRESSRKKLGSVAATLVSLVLLIVVVVGLISMLIPQLITSIKGVIDALPYSIRNLELWLEQMFADNPDMEAQVMQYYDLASAYLQNWLTNGVMPNISGILSGLSSSLISAVGAVLDAVIGLIVMVYLLNMKDKLLTQAKMIIYGVFPVKIANKVIEEARYVHSVFGGFIIGKLLDSLIIGLLCFVVMSVAGMPYVLLVSVIVGVTNIIPFFGPFIGAVPSAFLILMDDPMMCLYFLILILLLQQFDGNILGPRILAQSTGLSAFWVVFSVMLFGGLFGVMGMLLGVPVFGVIYYLVKTFVEYCLRRKGLPEASNAYEKVWSISGGEPVIIYSQEEEEERPRREQLFHTEKEGTRISRNKKGGPDSGRKRKGNHKD